MASSFVLSFDNIKAWCQRQSYEFSENADLGQLAIHYMILGKPSPLMVLPQLSRGLVMFVMKQPFAVSPDRRDAVAEGAGRVNATLFMGAWVLNHGDGELFFRATIPALDTAYTDQGLLHVGRLVVGTSEKLAPAFRSIALEGADPATVLAAADPP